MKTTQSNDGTLIAFDQVGQGTAVILVGGALGVRSHPAFMQLAELLAAHFTVYNYDRRGRGDSGDTLPYAVKREIEDMEAVIEKAGGSAYVYGVSAGAVLALEAAATFPTKIIKLALYEPPFILDNSRPSRPDNYTEHLNTLLASGRNGDAVAYFMTAAVGAPPESIVAMRSDPSWAQMEAVAHTIPYDETIVGNAVSGNRLKTERWHTATMPTLVMNGGNSATFFEHAAQVLTNGLPDARHHIIAGQDHGIASDVLAPLLIEFFEGNPA